MINTIYKYFLFIFVILLLCGIAVVGFCVTDQKTLGMIGGVLVCLLSTIGLFFIVYNGLRTGMLPVISYGLGLGGLPISRNSNPYWFWFIIISFIGLGLFFSLLLLFIIFVK